MAAQINPLASATGGLEFARLPSEEVRKISVKRIHITPALDSMFGPIPGGLHDPALGAISTLDTNCTTCRMSAVHCTGHCGHIELPTPCYHPQFIDLTLRILRAKCIYCHYFRLPQNAIHQLVCQLRLLQHGLVAEFQDLQRFRLGSKRKRTRDPEEMDIDESEEDIDDLMDRRERFVGRCMRKAKKDKERLPFLRNPVAIQARKAVIVDFLQQMTLVKKCSRCKGVTPSYRRDQRTKIFRKPLPPKAREAMKILQMIPPNPLIYLQQEQKQRSPAKPVMVNGIKEHAKEIVEEHGAEQEIALKNALETAASDKTGETEVDLETQAYMTPAEVHAALTLLFEREQEIVSLLFAPYPGRKHVRVSADMFFINNVLVPPNRFRPLARQGANQILEAQQNGVLNRVISTSNELQSLMRNSRKQDPDVRKPSHAQLLQAGIALQESVNGLIDNPSSPTGAPREQGVKQILEKKEGLFRMHMMGKRVNYAARSVISPDPNIETNEIGVPLVFAKKLTYPEPVTNHNFDAMSRAVINGVDKFPGAVAIENEHGQVMSLRRKTLDQRKALAKQLLTSTIPGVKGDNSKKVYRHLQTGDVVIMNRQPTLHKPSMMGHRARVLQNEKTIRMHYANCNTYNADFDGDEMNMHFPQNELARSEALQIADTDHQYLSATAGKPLRGLIQDHISMGVQFTSRDVFFDREQYQQLLYNCLRPEDYNTIHEKILVTEPSILKPKMLWTGKQVITTILKNITPDRFRGINLTSKSSTSSDQWGESTVKSPDLIKVTKDTVAHVDTEQVVIFKDGEHLSGILDKAQLGPANGGLIHSVHELYGHITAGRLLSILGRVLTRFLNERAWTCGMDDLYLTNQGNNTRRQALSKSKRLGYEVSVGYVQLKNDEPKDDNSELAARLENVLRNDDQLNSLDQLYKSRTKAITDEVAKVLPSGLRKPFPRNQMQAMTLSGAKGSNVNANLISCNLGQQVLEGRRVPTMVSGKTLPSFRAFETDPVAGGYISGRFLTGIRPQEYFFHAMSGREGLIDTAVKTAKSGYLQRCIVKGLEGLKTEYDSSVREASNGSIVQFLYGEDGLEVTKQKHLREFTFLAENHQSVMAFMRADEVVPKFIDQSKSDQLKVVMKSARKGRLIAPLTDEFSPANYFGSTSEDFANSLSQYLKNNPTGLIRDKKAGIEGRVGKKTFQGIMELKYMRSVVDAGEAVGVVAAQSVGEPSTQMTLNTFHLAGHSAKNVTLGIPRLREIIMTASAKIMTPTMTLKPNEELSIEEATRFAKGISKLSLAHVIKELTVTERANSHEKLYDIKMDLYEPAEYIEEYAITIDDVAQALENKFLALLKKLLDREFKKKAREADMSQTTAAVPEIGASVGPVEQERPANRQANEREGGEDDIDEDADMDDARDAAARARREDEFDEPDDDEQQIIEEESEEEISDAEEQAKMSQKVQDDNDSELSEEDAEEQQAALKEVNPHLKRYHFSKSKANFCRLTLTYSSNTPKVLLQPVIEKCAHAAVIQSIPGLGICSLFMEEVHGTDGKVLKRVDEETGKEEDVKEPIITCEGVNLVAMRHYQDAINPHTLYTNSVHDMLKLYGVEAARMTIVKEIDNVFKGHGISVDYRHISLIADAMTHTGSYQSFSRHGLVKEGGSVLAKMSFETVMGFLKEAVLYGEKDPLLGPSARIVAGRRGNIGTGSFDVIMPV